MAYFDCSIPKNKKRILTIISKLKDGVEIARELRIKNLLYNEAYVDLMIAVYLNHKYNIETQNGDALDTEGNPVEYNVFLKRMGFILGRFNFTGYPKKK